MNWSAAARWTTLIRGFCGLALLFFSAGQTMGQPGLLSSSDTAIGIDLDSTFISVPAMNNGRYPAAEGPRFGIDGLPGTKYLNFGHAGSGFIVTPSLTGIPVDGFRITTANDAPGRDPAMWSLYGFNGMLTTTDSGASPAINQTGTAEAWVPIASGSVALPGNPTIGGDQRGVVGPMVPVNSTTAYDHYKFIVDAIKRPSDNIMQFADIQFFIDDTDPNSGFLAALDPIIAVDETPVPPFAGWKPCGTPNTDCSSSPGGEQPPLAIDQSLTFSTTGAPITTKYLNFGEQNSGIIITNSEGPVDVNFMRLRTANDASERDPASFRLFGTNDPITSEPNSPSNGTETWTLIAESTETSPLVLPTARHTWGDFVAVNSPANYRSYRLVFPTVRNGATANSMQIADIQFYTAIPEPSTMALVGLMGLAFAAATRRRG
jgi:PEP-CTERM motif